MNEPGLTFQAIFVKANTTVDGGWRVTFDVSQDESDKVVHLSQLMDLLLQLAVVPVDSN